jgi:hypothetical protein
MAVKKAGKKTTSEKVNDATVAATAQPQVKRPQADAAQQPAADLTIQDLRSIVAIIDIASQRGAFRANEMAAVGVTYNKVNAFLNKVAPQPPADAPAKTEEKK